MFSSEPSTISPEPVSRTFKQTPEKNQLSLAAHNFSNTSGIIWPIDFTLLS